MSAVRLFTTERLVARHMTEEDIETMFAVYGDADAARWVDDGQPIERAECDRWFDVTRANYAKRGYGMSVLELRANGEPVGFCGLVHPGGQTEAEIKYALLREYWGQGLATEAATAMIAYGAREFGLRHVIATTAPENGASHRVLLKSGMREIEPRYEDDGTPIKVFEWRAPDCAGDPSAAGAVP